jgi:hypothetical protein
MELRWDLGYQTISGLPIISKCLLGWLCPEDQIYSENSLLWWLEKAVPHCWRHLRAISEVRVDFTGNLGWGGGGDSSSDHRSSEAASLTTCLTISMDPSSLASSIHLLLTEFLLSSMVLACISKQTWWFTEVIAFLRRHPLNKETNRQDLVWHDVHLLVSTVKRSIEL